MIKMYEFAKIHIRSIVGIIATSCVIAYLQPTDPIIVGGYLTATVAMVMLDKGIQE